MGHYYYNYLNNYEQSSAVPNTEFLKKVNHTHIHGLAENRTHCPLTPDENLPLELYISSLKNLNYSGIYNLEFSFDRFPEINKLESHIFQSIEKLKSALK